MYTYKSSMKFPPYLLSYLVWVSFLQRATVPVVRLDFDEHTPRMVHGSFSTSVKTLNVYLIMDRELLLHHTLEPVCRCAHDRVRFYRQWCYPLSICHRDCVAFHRHVTVDLAAAACYDDLHSYLWWWRQRHTVSSMLMIPMKMLSVHFVHSLLPCVLMAMAYAVAVNLMFEQWVRVQYAMLTVNDHVSFSVNIPNMNRLYN